MERAPAEDKVHISMNLMDIVANEGRFETIEASAAEHSPLTKLISGMHEEDVWLKFFMHS